MATTEVSDSHDGRGTAATADEVSELGDLLLHRLETGPELAPHIDATAVLRVRGGEAWTLRIRAGRPALAPDADPDPDTTVTGDAATMRGLASGEVDGVAAFLDGRVTVRGNLALSLRLSGLWTRADRPRDHAVAREVGAAGLRTFYLEAGEGPPVVLLHGLGATNASMLPTLRALAPDHRVIAPDLPGFGETDKPLRNLHAAYFTRWLVAFLDAVDVERAHLIGNSMGGRVAVEVGLRHPERVDRIALLAPSPAFLDRREWVRVVRLLRPELAVVPLPLPRGYVERGIRRMFARPERLDDEWYAAATDEFVRVMNSVRGRICFFSAARQIYLEEPHGDRGGFWARLPDLERPSLFIWGAEDRLVPARFADHVQRALPAARSVVLDDCGHVPQFELPERTHELVREHLEGGS